MQYSFGSGSLYGRQIVTGSNVPTPVRFGALQACTLDFSFTTKELHGQYQFPLALGRGSGKITGKADFAQFNAQAFNDLFFGNANLPIGSTRTALAETSNVSGTTVTVTHSATFLRDLGVVLAADGSVFTRVVSGPSGTEYSANETSGVYTFNASHANAAVLVSYAYTDASNGKTITLTNQLLGVSPTFLAVFTETFNTKSMTLTLNCCQSSKLSIATKLEDFTTPDFSFMAFADAAGVVGTISLDE